MEQDRAILRMADTNMKSYMIYQKMPFSMTLNELLTDFKGTPLFDVEYLRTAQDENIVTME